MLSRIDWSHVCVFLPACALQNAVNQENDLQVNKKSVDWWKKREERRCEISLLLSVDAFFYSFAKILAALYALLLAIIISADNSSK